MVRVHSSLVGPGTWASVAEVLDRMGITTLVPDLVETATHGTGRSTRPPLSVRSAAFRSTDPSSSSATVAPVRSSRRLPADFASRSRATSLSMPARPAMADHASR